jgi:tRNA threonylcarbamoyladenosine biosynthesis protein TsaB
LILQQIEKMPLLLLIETATEICSVAVSRDGTILKAASAAQDFEHSSQLTLLIQYCLSETGYPFTALDAIALSKGPGSYTSLRIGTSVAKGICYAMDIPLVAIDTLAAIAWATSQIVQKTETWYCPMIDARRMEVYTAIFDTYGNQLTLTENLIVHEHSFENHFDKGQHICFSGNGAPKCHTVITSPFAIFQPLACDAKHLMILAENAFKEQQFEDIAYFEPFYGKAPNITTPKLRL